MICLQELKLIFRRTETDRQTDVEVEVVIEMGQKLGFGHVSLQ